MFVATLLFSVDFVFQKYCNVSNLKIRSVCLCLCAHAPSTYRLIFLCVSCSIYLYLRRWSSRKITNPWKIVGLALHDACVDPVEVPAVPPLFSLVLFFFSLSCSRTFSISLTMLHMRFFWLCDISTWRKKREPGFDQQARTSLECTHIFSLLCLRFVSLENITRIASKVVRTVYLTTIYTTVEQDIGTECKVS